MDHFSKTDSPICQVDNGSFPLLLRRPFARPLLLIFQGGHRTRTVAAAAPTAAAMGNRCAPENEQRHGLSSSCGGDGWGRTYGEVSTKSRSRAGGCFSLVRLFLKEHGTRVR